MPLGRYFLYIGGVLFALLLITDWYFPPSSSNRVRSGVDRTAIRIHSAHKWPAAVVIDTSLPTIVPPAAKTMAAAAPAPPPPASRPREAFAEAAPAIKPAEAVKPAKWHIRRPRAPRAPAGQVASYDMFGSRSMWPANW